MCNRRFDQIILSFLTSSFKFLFFFLIVFLHLSLYSFSILSLSLFFHLIPTETFFAQIFTSIRIIRIISSFFRISWLTILRIFRLLVFFRYCAKLTITLTHICITIILGLIPSSPSAIFYEFLKIRSDSL